MLTVKGYTYQNLDLQPLTWKDTLQYLLDSHRCATSHTAKETDSANDTGHLLILTQNDRMAWATRDLQVHRVPLAGLPISQTDTRSGSPGSQAG